MALDDAANTKFVADYDKQDGVHKTASGLRYKVITDAPAGGKKPGPRSNVTVHYRGTLVDGTEIGRAHV